MRAGVILQPKQLLASAMARECDKPDGPRALLIGGARGPGKSHWGVAQVGVDDCQRFPGLKFLLLRKVGKSAKESFNDLRRVVFRNIPNKYNQSGICEFDNGSRIVVGHFQNESDIDNYLGLEYDGALIEELGTLTSSKIKDIRTVIRTSKEGWRPRIYGSTNPGGVGHAYCKKEFVDPHRRGKDYAPVHEQTGDTRFVHATVYDNKFVDPDYLKSLEDLTGWKRRAWLHGDWDIAAGQFFTTWNRDAHVVKAFDIPRNWRVWCALDYGFTHYTSVHLLAENDGKVYAVDEHCERNWLPQRHAAAIHAMLEKHGRKVTDLWQFVAGADIFSKRPDGGTTADHYREHLGIKLKPANDDRINGAAEMLDRLGDIEGGIAPSFFIFERCARLIECVPMLEHDPHRPEDVLKVDTDEDGLGGDDPYDSCRYGLMEAVKKRKKFTVY